MRLRKTVIMVIAISVISCILGCAALTTYGKFTSKGDAAREGGRFQTAIQCYLQALEAKPDHEPALSGLEEAARGYYQAQIQDIQSMQAAGSWGAATEQARMSLDLLRRVRAHDVSFPTIAELQKLERMLTAGNERLAEACYSRGMKSLGDQDYRRALAQLQECLSYARDYKDTGALIEEAKQGLADQLYTQGVQASESGDWLAALGQFQEAASLMPGYEDVDQRIQTAKETLAEESYQNAQEILDAAGETLSVKPYREAMGHLEDCLSYVPDYKDAPLKYQEARENAVVRVVILPFESSPASIGDALTQQVITYAIQQKPEMVTFVDRQYVTGFLLSERDLADMGIVSAQNAIQIGRVANVHGLVAGKAFATRTDKPEESVGKKGTYQERYTDSQGNSRTMEKTYDYELHTKAREVSVQVSYQLISAETGAIITGESLSEAKSDYAQWVRTQPRYAELAVKEESGNLTATKEPKTLDALQQEAVQSLSGQLADRIISNVQLLVR